jgi:hypothetical protein
MVSPFGTVQVKVKVKVLQRKVKAQREGVV